MIHHACTLNFRNPVEDFSLMSALPSPLVVLEGTKCPAWRRQHAALSSTRRLWAMRGHSANTVALSNTPSPSDVLQQAHGADVVVGGFLLVPLVMAPYRCRISRASRRRRRGHSSSLGPSRRGLATKRLGGEEVPCESRRHAKGFGGVRQRVWAGFRAVCRGRRWGWTICRSCSRARLSGGGIEQEQHSEPQGRQELNELKEVGRVTPCRRPRYHHRHGGAPE